MHLSMASFAIPYLLFFLFLFLPHNLSMANITLGSSLTATTDGNSSWLSPSREFAFGFHQLNNSNLFLIAIWFNQIPERTIVWYANGNNPVPSGSKVELSTSGGLVLSNPEGKTIWEVNPAPPVSYAAMLDTGNFVLAVEGNDSYAWETFKNPTDTILPTQVLDLGAMLFSRLTETDYSKGRFELHFSEGNLELNPIAWPSEFQYDSYYSSGTSNENSSESGYRLVFNESANIYIVKLNGEIAPFPNWDTVATSAYNYYRATLDFDGVFTQYVYPKNSNADESWQPLQSIPENICNNMSSQFGSGACGFNSYCLIQNRKPTCLCPPGYMFIDPNNTFGGCKPNFPQGCGVDDGSKDPEELYELKVSTNINFPFGDYERLSPFNQTECWKSCLNDCLCSFAMISGTDCWKKRLPLSNGRFSNIEFGTNLMKVRKGAPPSSSNSFGRKKETSILVGVGVSVFFNICLAVSISLIVFMRRTRKVEQGVQDPRFIETNLRFFTYKELEEVTDGFNEELGRGSFGIVYKGVHKAGSRNFIAVKKLDKLAQEREREFKTEMSAIGKIHHKNLVQLLGFCDEGSHRVLVYEFMSNGTLADFLFALPRPDWNQRVKIALGIARGLVYLHEECDVPIIHCDIKPQNILLDEYFTARISDFGLAKFLLSDQSRTRTMIRGTRGYVALEWFKNVPVTAKVDVYSFGVMLLEIICCRKCVVMEFEEEESAILTDWAYDCYIDGRVDVLVDNDKEAMGDKDRLHRWVTIAIWCIQEDPSNRPTMKMVLQMLEGFVEVPLLPRPSSYIQHIEN